jgi:hypothetical protein
MARKTHEGRYLVACAETVDEMRQYIHFNLSDNQRICSVVYSEKDGYSIILEDTQYDPEADGFEAETGIRSTR